MIIASNYDADCSWIPKETDDFFIYDRTGCGIRHNVEYVPNIGNADYDKLTYIIDHYENLPEVFTLIKSNLFKYISKEEYDKVKNNTTYTPLLTAHHKTYLPVCFYDEQGMYNEIANSWFLNEVPAKHVSSWQEWCDMFGLPDEPYVSFAPGGNYIVTKDRILRHPRKLYKHMRSLLEWAVLPGEAQCVERTYHTLWK